MINLNKFKVNTSNFAQPPPPPVAGRALAIPMAVDILRCFVAASDIAGVTELEEIGEGTLLLLLGCVT